MDTVTKLEIERFFEIEDNFMGRVVGFYCNGHIDKQRFLGYAVCEWQELQEEELECDDIDEISPATFSLQDVKHRYYRYPYKSELENGQFDLELEFIFFDEPSDNTNAITYVEL